MQTDVVLGFLLTCAVLVTVIGLTVRVARDLGPRWWIPVLLLKLAMGVAYTWGHEVFMGGGDIFDFMTNARLLLEHSAGDPGARLTLLFGRADAEVTPRIAPAVEAMNFWFHPSPYLMVRWHALLHMVSGGHPVVHSLLAALPGAAGTILLIGAFRHAGMRSPWVALSILLWPSVLFWTSGMHKEGVMLACMGGLASATTAPPSLRWPVRVLAGLVLGVVIIIVRDFLFLAILPGMAVWPLLRTVRWPMVTTVGAYAAAWVATLLLRIPRYGMKGYELLLWKRQQFLDLGSGTTSFDMMAVEQPVAMPVAVAQALFNTLVRPIPTDLTREVIVLAFAENLGLCILVGVAMWRLLIDGVRTRPWGAVAVCMSVTLLVLIGLVVPNAGAIFRYKSLALAFLVPALVQISLRARSNGGFRVGNS